MKWWYESLFENYGRTYDSETSSKGRWGSATSSSGNCRAIARIASWISDAAPAAIPWSLPSGAIWSSASICPSPSWSGPGEGAGTGAGRRVPEGGCPEPAVRGGVRCGPHTLQGGFPAHGDRRDELRYTLRGGPGPENRGHLLFTTLNGLFPLFHSIEKFCASIGACPGTFSLDDPLIIGDFKMLVTAYKAV